MHCSEYCYWFKSDDLLLINLLINFQFVSCYPVCVLLTVIMSL